MMIINTTIRGLIQEATIVCWK